MLRVIIQLKVKQKNPIFLFIITFFQFVKNFDKN